MDNLGPVVFRQPDGGYEVSCRQCPWKSAYTYKYLESARSIGRLHVQIKHEPIPKEVREQWRQKRKAQGSSK